jgi:hypothetical protein
MSRFVLVAAACVLGVAGCSNEPRAPALIDSPVYQNDGEGFRFLVPDGWKISAKAEMPPGKLDKERLLVQYHRTGDATKATLLEVSAADLPVEADLAQYLAGPSFGAGKWNATSKPEVIPGHGVEGLRLSFRGQVERTGMMKEVVAFRRKQRVYFFTMIAANGDGTAPDQFHRAVESVVWKD